LVSRSVERYLVTRKVPFWGGPQSYRIDVTTKVGDRIGPVQQLRVSTFVFPWVLLVLAGVATSVIWLGRRLLRRRSHRYADIQADLRRMEKLLGDQRASASPAAATRGSATAQSPPASAPARPSTMPDMAEILAGESTPSQPPPTRWSGLLDDVRSRSLAADPIGNASAGSDNDHSQDAVADEAGDDRSTDREADAAIRAAAKQARRAGDDETAARLEDSLRGWL
jgi:hypothetical protein